ncbi:hypothetical protein [Pseudonocardia pini]|uniref:hypothetical protein n=1 Tax=Pseudonocardia pini TaxID=2758030 RepID=UPI0015EFF76D|nr:hypothetical protein [Pseudonocardia pini]
MARSTPSAVVPTAVGATPTGLTPNADGDIVPIGVSLLVRNGSGAPITVTLQSTYARSGRELPDGGGSVPAGGYRVFGPIDSTYRQPADATVGPNLALVDYSAVASVERILL